MVAKAVVESGTKTSPIPIPCSTPEMTNGRLPMTGEKPVIRCSE